MCNQAPILLIYDRYLIGAPLLGAQTIPEAISQLDPAVVAETIHDPVNYFNEED